MRGDDELLQRYLDGEMSPHESASFRARLSLRPELKARLDDFARVGALLRCWAADVQSRAADLVAPTLQRVLKRGRARAARRFSSRAV